MTSYIKETLLGSAIQANDTVAVSLYGKPTSYKVVEILDINEISTNELGDDSQVKESRKFLVTKRYHFIRLMMLYTKYSTTISYVNSNQKKSDNSDEQSMSEMRVILDNQDQKVNDIKIAGVDNEINQLMKVVKDLTKTKKMLGVFEKFTAVKVD